jgi:hypothetical protein
MTVYMPLGADANEHWLIVREALEEAGIRDIRPAPPQSLAFKPKQCRPILLASAEI